MIMFADLILKTIEFHQMGQLVEIFLKEKLHATNCKLVLVL
jgi:hypothetical protein